MAPRGGNQNNLDEYFKQEMNLTSKEAMTQSEFGRAQEKFLKKCVEPIILENPPPYLLPCATQPPVIASPPRTHDYFEEVDINDYYQKVNQAKQLLQKSQQQMSPKQS